MRALVLPIAVALTPATGIAAEPASNPPNILILLADDLGTDKVAAYREHPDPPATPNLDALAAQGVLFRNAYGYSVCSPTRAALMTGRYGRRNGLGAIIDWGDTWELPLDEVTLPEMLDAGPDDWGTVAVGKWHLSAPKTPSGIRHPQLQGFDHYSGSIHNLYFDTQQEKSNYFAYDKVVDGVAKRVAEYATHATTTDALAAMAKLREPWLIYVAYNAAHTPFHVPPGSSLGTNATAAQKYDAMVEDLDAEIGRLLTEMPPATRANTLVLFLGDNGTPGEAVLAPRSGDQAKKTLYEGGTNIPLIVAGPGVAHGGESAALVHAVDVLPTLAELSGVPATPTGLPLDGTSFAAALADPHQPVARRFVFTERLSEAGPPPYRSDLRSVRDDRYKLANYGDGWKLYDLQGRFDDGPGRDPATLGPEEKARYLALQAELERLEREVRFAY